MRFVLYGLFLVFWFAMWWWTYTCHIKTSCCGAIGVGEPISLIEVDRDDERPIVFRWSDAQPIATNRFEPMRDSLMRALSGGKVLEITGLYYRDEEQPEGQDLGMARAGGIRSILAEAISSERVIMKSEIADLTGDVRNRFFSAVRFRALLNNEHIQELDDRAILFFPLNSTEPDLSPQIERYLDGLVERLDTSNENIVLTGHTDDEGSDNSNYYIGHWRADAIKDALVARGVDESRISVDSKGEIAPLAQNSTRTGKEKNRRVELRLTNSN